MIKTISSLHNPHIKAAARLRTRRGRQQQKKIIIDGVRQIERALEGGILLDVIYFHPSLAELPAVEGLIERLTPLPTTIITAPSELIQKIAFGQQPESIVAIAPEPIRNLSQIQLGDLPLVAVVEEIEKPGNLGAIIRTADGAGVDALLVIGGTDIYNPNAIRASLGTLFTLPVIATTTEEAIAWIRQNRLAIFASRVEGSIDYTAANFRQRCAIILGSEADGLSPKWAGSKIDPISLPMHGKGDSLNVSVAAAILLYEARRQRSETIH